MSDIDIAALSKRIDALERAAIQFKIPHGDPPPDDLGQWRWQIFQRLQDLERLIGRWRTPIADPAPEDLASIRPDMVRSRLAEIARFQPGWFTDPPPDDFLNVRILDLIRRYRGGFTDPVPEDFANVRLRDVLQRIPGGGIVDPGPDDIGRLTVTEIETQLHKIGAESVRLKSIERLMQDRLQQLKGGKKQ
jgi:hypothetical protein